MARLKKPRVTKISKTQTGKTNTKADKKRSALKPGTRISAAGNTYTEKRRNRSDKNAKKKL